MSEQLELDHGLRDWVTRQRRPLVEEIEGAIVDLGSMEVAASAALTRRQDLRGWLDDRTGRHLPVSAVWGIGRLVDGRRVALANALVRPLGLIAVPPMSDKERADRLEAYLLGQPCGATQVAAALAGRR